MTAAARADRHRKLLPYAAALVALATLGACTGSDPGQDTATPPVTSSTPATTTAVPSTTTKPTPTATVDPVIAKIPAAARAKTEAGAQAFARFFIESLNTGATTANPQVLEGLFTPACETCKAMHDSLQTLKMKHQRHTAPSIKVTGTTAVATTGSARQVLIDVQQISVAVIDSKGNTIRTTAEGPGAFVMTLGVAHGHWVAQRLQTAS
ncbi:DUF6318 family protein [Terrabacter terrigena]|uniref:DUF6318 family protein n=1 Tax=Terrabacter terrigena TaxID=574718 RepID=A0ABW3N2G5_9MICO